MKKPFLLLTSVALLCGGLQAATVNYDFSTQAQFTDNFTITNNGGTNGTIDWNAAGDVRLTDDANIGSFAVVTTNANTFLTETISGNVSTTASNGSFGLYSRVTAGNLGVVALANFTPTQVRIRLFYGATVTSGGVGTNFYDSGSLTPANALDLSDFNFDLTQTSGADPVFNFSLSDAQGIVLSSGDRILTGSDDYNSAGKIGFRYSMDGGQQGNFLAVNSVSAIPEPGSFALLGGFLALSAVMLRRRRA